jgi:uncharacterized membrane protein YfcA
MRTDAGGFLAGLLLAALAAPVGVSGAVFLLPVQLNLLGVPNPQLTPTNLLFNVISGPGALVAYLRRGGVDGGLTARIVAGSAPGVVVGAVLRVYVAEDLTTFRVVAAAVLLPTGLLILRRRRPSGFVPRWPPALITGLAFVVGIAGGLYGIGGGSLLGPLLVSGGYAVSRVAPAALVSTFVTSVIGVATYALLTIDRGSSVSPDWSLGIACGLGGLVGGYAGARLQPRLPERLLRGLLGGLALALAVLYAVQAALG